MTNAWLSKKDIYMSTLLEFEALGQDVCCARCEQVTPSPFRCLTCLGCTKYCQTCMVHVHCLTPFHRIVSWSQSSRCFVDTSLAVLSLILDLGPAKCCPNCTSSASTGNITVVHTNGIHEISARFHICSHSPSQDIQLFAFRLFPATVNSPQTAFSFELLEQFHFHHLEGKGSAYSFMNAISRLTSDDGHRKVEVRVLCATLLSH